MNQYSMLRRGALRLIASTITIFSICSAVDPVRAGEADGSYRVTRVTAGGSFPSLGDNPDLKNKILQAVSTDNQIVVTNNQITIQREKWMDVLDHFNFVFFGGTAKITGSKSLTLQPSGDFLVGKTARPLNVNLTGSFLSLPVSMNLRATCRAKVSGNQLVLTFPTRISSDGEISTSGTIRVVARRR